MSINIGYRNVVLVICFWLLWRKFNVGEVVADDWDNIFVISVSVYVVFYIQVNNIDKLFKVYSIKI